MRYNLDQVDASRGETYALAKQFGNTLLDNCIECLGTAPLYKDGALVLSRAGSRSKPRPLTVTFPTAPKTTVTPKGDIKYEEVARPKITRLEKYVQEMAAGSTVTPQINVSRPSWRLW